MIKTIRAFFVALGMTLRGQTPPPRRHAALWAWIQQAERLIEAAYQAAQQGGLDDSRRKSITVKVDGRARSMESILGTVRFHLREEYPYLLKNETEHSLTAIQASNLNDHYAVLRLSESAEAGGMRAALESLAAHLESLPRGDESQGD
jgi:hypothetical protein